MCFPVTKALFPMLEWNSDDHGCVKTEYGWITK